ncbi:TPA: hypothetical protein KQG29_001420 [Clostridioides difficile]|nr:hypothetical protein [Clostridioides difficile]
MFEVIFKLSISCIVITIFGFCVMYNKKLINLLEKSKIATNNKFQEKFGKKLRQLSRDTERKANINKNTLNYKLYIYFKDIIENLDMEKDNVTPSGLVIFIASLSFVFSTIFSVIVNSVNLTLPMFCAFFYLILVVFKFMSLTRYEKKEAQIMDMTDLLVSDIRGGVLNAIRRYKNSVHPNLRIYVHEFLDDIDNKSYSFEKAIKKLNDKLGHNFTEFCIIAISYESKADEHSESEFSIVMETNAEVRNTREENNKIFNERKIQIIASMLLIGAYCVFSIYEDRFMMNFFLNNTFGKLSLVADVGLVAWSLAYLTSVKSQSL